MQNRRVTDIQRDTHKHTTTDNTRDSIASRRQKLIARQLRVVRGENLQVRQNKKAVESGNTQPQSR